MGPAAKFESLLLKLFLNGPSDHKLNRLGPHDVTPFQLPGITEVDQQVGVWKDDHARVSSRLLSDNKQMGVFRIGTIRTRDLRTATGEIESGYVSS